MTVPLALLPHPPIMVRCADLLQDALALLERTIAERICAGKRVNLGLGHRALAEHAWIHDRFIPSRVWCGCRAARLWLVLVAVACGPARRRRLAGRALDA